MNPNWGLNNSWINCHWCLHIYMLVFSHTCKVLQVTWISLWFCSQLVQIYWPPNISLLGAFTHACRCSGHHLVAYKENCSLFDVILSLSRHTIPTPSLGGTLAYTTSIHFEEEHVKEVARTSQFMFLPSTRLFHVLKLLFYDTLSTIKW